MKNNIFVIVSYLFKISLAILYEGDNCKLALQESGICVHLSQCPSAIKLIHNKQHPEICSYNKTIPIVCCPLDSEPTSARISERKCESYKMLTTITTTARTTTTTTTTTTANSNNPYRRKGIVGGIKSIEKEFPHMAALGFSSDNLKLWLCGGSLISEKFVLTAAHCLFSREYGALTWVRVGDLDLASKLDDDAAQEYQITKRISHPQYKSPSVYNDIALVELEQNVQFSSYVKPACLPSTSNLNLNTELIAIGWGLTEFQGSKSDILLKVKLSFFVDEECNKAYEDMINTRRLKNGILHEIMFCAGGRTEEKDTCQGDSGGPLQIHNGNTFTIVGVTSFGKTCGVKSLPGVYTKVASYVPWIESIVWPEEH